MNCELDNSTVLIIKFYYAHITERPRSQGIHNVDSNESEKNAFIYAQRESDKANGVNL